MNSIQKNYTITGHMVVKNEDRWIWYSIMSVIDFLDVLIIFDTGSVDKTKVIIKDIIKTRPEYQNKIIYEEYKDIQPEAFFKMRQRQIEMTKSDYFMIVDGDEIWWEEGLNEMNKVLRDKSPSLVATKFINCCGDIYHYRYDYREHYNIAGIIGNITIRVYSMKIKGIACSGEYGKEGFIDYTGKMVQDRNYDTIITETPYFHTSLLTRSSAQLGDYSVIYRKNKLHMHWDARFDADYKFPEVFYSERPKYIKGPFEKDTNILHNIYNAVHVLKGKIRKIFHINK